MQSQFPWVIRAVVSQCSPKKQQSLFLLCFSSCASHLLAPLRWHQGCPVPGVLLTAGGGEQAPNWVAAALHGHF